MKNIYEGMLKKDGQRLPFQVCELTKNHLQKILFIQEQVIVHLEEKSKLSPLSQEDFAYILDGKGLMLGVMVNDELIAFRALLVPQIDEEHLGKDIGLPNEELSKVIYQEISCVLPDYRGNQLQKTLAALIMQELGETNHRFRYVCCTVAPFNIPSLKDKFTQGMKIAALKEKYGGKLRYVFVLDLAESEETEWVELINIPMDDISSQQEKISEGYRGINMVNVNNTLCVTYGKNRYFNKSKRF